MNYKEFNDYEVLDQVYSCNEDANEVLLYKYRPLIVNIAKKLIPYCQGGVDLSDLIQEGMLGLNEAINSFREDKEANFGTYARICIRRKIVSLVKSTRTQKNMILNDSISIEDEDGNLFDRFLVDNSFEPSIMVEDYDSQQRLIKKLNEKLTDYESQVFELKKDGFDYKEIADILEKEPKAIDNTIQRIKAKLKSIIEQSD